MAGSESASEPREPPGTTFLRRLASVTEKGMRALDRAGVALIVAIFGAVVLVGGLQVCSRYVFNASLAWSEEFQRYGLIWIVFLTLVVGYRRGAHIGMEVLVQAMPRFVQVPLAWFADILWLAVGLAMVVFTGVYRTPAGLNFLATVGRQTSAGLGLRMDIVYACILISGAYLTLAALNNLLRRAAGERVVVASETEPC